MTEMICNLASSVGVAKESAGELHSAGYVCSGTALELPPRSITPGTENQRKHLKPFVKPLVTLHCDGQLSGEEDRSVMTRGISSPRSLIKDYPDITHIASVAKTKKNFHEILASPMGSPIASKVSSPQSTYIDDAASTMMSGNSEGSVDTEQADLLWKLAKYGSPALKPLGGAELESDGTQKTGVYICSPMLRYSTDSIVNTIFKPLDEEDFERRGIEKGLGALREEAAFIIDHEAGGKACVPVTARVSLQDDGVQKKGSVQKFVQGSLGPVENFGMPRGFEDATAMVALDTVQAVACLDIRIFNTDRHTGNLLLAGSKPHQLISIDHGCVLPAWWALDSARFDAWLEWPHVKAPVSEATLALVRQVEDTLPHVIQELGRLEIPLEAIWTFRICTLLLVTCVLRHGMTLRAIGLLMSRADPAEPCWLECQIEKACVAAGISAEFRAEGKYGDSMFFADQQILNLFGISDPPARFYKFSDQFFSFLKASFAHTDVVAAAAAAEEAIQLPFSSLGPAATSL